MATSPAPLTRESHRSLDRLLARTDAYRLLALALRDPDEPGAEDALCIADLRSAVGDLHVSAPAGAWDALQGIERADARATEHRAVFGHVVAHGCPPYETEFGRGHVFAQSQQLGDICGFYEAFGVRPRAGGERPDHVACELEFLALLAVKEAAAIATGTEAQRTVCREAAGAFLEDHVGRWVAALAGRMEARAPGSGLAAVAGIAAAVLADHAAELGRRPGLLAADDVVPVEGTPNGFAFECGADAEAGDMTPPGAA